MSRGTGLFLIPLFVTIIVSSIWSIDAQVATPVPRPSMNPLAESGGRPRAIGTDPGLADRTVLRPDEAFYRKPTHEELAKLRVDSEIAAKYAEYLKIQGTGLIKLLPDYGCDQHSNIFSAEPKCLEYSLPGAGNSYSFRFKNYRVRRFADVSIRDDGIISPGVLQHGIFADLGDVAIEHLGPTSPVILFLKTFEPSRSIKEEAEVRIKLAGGVEANGLRYASAARLKINHSYAFRSIAYRYKLSGHRVPPNRFMGLDDDIRRDILIVFRIVDMPSDGSVTILWRQLSSVASPLLKGGI